MRPSLAALLALLLLPAGAHAEGMPQLNFANPLLLSQVFWLAVIFLVLYVLLSRLALPQVASVLEQRETTIQADLDAAHRAKANADGAVTELTEASARARAEAQAAINRAADEAKREAATQAEALNARLEEQLSAAEARIKAAHTAAMGALRQVAGETASTLIGRLTNRPADPAAVDQAVGAEITARGLG